MDASTPLTALCNICHTSTPKYTCPRDKVRTCSLACARAHKTRASCSGVRDPAAYVPKRDLTTTSGIDRDYNFLTGVERNIDSAERDTKDRGVSLSGQGKVAWEKRWHGGGALARYLREHDIGVVRAPVGMARQKANQTRFIQKSRRIVWSVEWVLDGEKRITEVDEKMSLGDAYREFLVERERESKKRKRGLEEGGKTQKPKVERAAEAGAAETEEIQVAPTAQEKPLNGPEKLESIATDEVAPSNAPAQVSLDTSAPSTHEGQNPTPADQQLTSPLSKLQHQSSTLGSTQPASPEPHLFLHKPHTSSKNTVVIPVPSNITLTSALSRRSVLEYPTIYVFNSESSNTLNPESSNNQAADTQVSQSDGDKTQATTEPHVLPEGYITETAYHAEKASEDKEVQALLSSLPEDQRKALAAGNTKTSAPDGADWDEGMILESLKRDADALKK